MTTESNVKETNLYITVVPGHRIELEFLNYPTIDALSERETVVGRKYPGLEIHTLKKTSYMLKGSKVHNLEQIGREIKKHFEAFKFSFNVKGQIDLDYHSVDL